jgi:hypothetical protein
MPFPAIFANCAGWLGYAYTIRNVLVLVPNQIGLLLGLFYTLSCYGVADTKVRKRGLRMHRHARRNVPPMHTIEHAYVRCSPVMPS